MIPAPSRFFYLWQIFAASDDQEGFQAKLLKQAQDFLDKLVRAKLGDEREPISTLSPFKALPSALLDSFHELDADNKNLLTLKCRKSNSTSSILNFFSQDSASF